MKNKLLCILLAVSLCFGMFPSVFAANAIIDLNLADAQNDLGNLNSDGYHWDYDAATLTLQGVHIENLTLPDKIEVKIVTNEASTVDQMNFSTRNSSYHQYGANLVFDGKAPLTVTYGIGSFQATKIRVVKGAHLVVHNEINIGTSGGRDSLISVDGKLDVIKDSPYGNAVSCGLLFLGKDSVFNVTGAKNAVTSAGVALHGTQNSMNETLVIEDGAKLFINSNNRGLYVFAGREQITPQNLKDFITVPNTYNNPDSVYHAIIVQGMNGGDTEYAVAFGKETNNIILSSESVSGNTPIYFGYSMTEGMNGVWQKGTKDALRFKADVPFDKFETVHVDKTVIDASNYIAKEGSTVVSLKSSFLEKMPAGEHILGIDYGTGEVTTRFTVLEAEEKPIEPDITPTEPGVTEPEVAPDTSDSAKLIIFIAFAVISASMIFATVYFRYKEKHNK